VSPPVQAARNYTHHRHLLLLSPKADTHNVHVNEEDYNNNNKD